MSLPLNAIPVLGTVAWIYLNGFVYAWELHQMYFDLIGADLKVSFSHEHQDQRSYVSKHKARYASFGSIAFLLELIPGFNFIFLFTNAVGSALWAVDIERRGGITGNAVNRPNISMPENSGSNLLQ